MTHTVLVTGASGGIGAAVARRFARAGHRVLLHGNSRFERAEALCRALKGEGCTAAALRADLKNESEIAALAAEAQTRFGTVDILVNNAGMALPEQLLTDCQASDWDALFSVNVRGLFLLTRALIPAMVSQKRGSIVNISSMWGLSGASCEAPYSASKAAVVGFTRALALELGPSGVRVNCVAPGYIETEMNAGYTPEETEAFRLDTPLQTLGAPEDVAAAVAFLALDDARFITGQVLSVAGGR